MEAGVEEKCGGGATHQRWSQGSIPVVQGPKSRKEASVMLLESRRGFWAAPVGSGAAELRSRGGVEFLLRRS